MINLPCQECFDDERPVREQVVRCIDLRCTGGVGLGVEQGKLVCDAGNLVLAYFKTEWICAIPTIEE